MSFARWCHFVHVSMHQNFSSTPGNIYWILMIFDIVINVKQPRSLRTTFTENSPTGSGLCPVIKIRHRNVIHLFYTYQRLHLKPICNFVDWQLRESHDDVIKWKHFPRYWTFVRGIHRSPVNSPQKGQWRGALMFFLICVWINGSVNNRETGDWRRYRAHYDVTVMQSVWEFLSGPRATLLHWRYTYVMWLWRPIDQHNA